MTPIRLALATALLTAGTTIAVAQTAPGPTNPLRPGSTTRTVPAPHVAPAPAQPATAAEEPKAKRQRSAAQLANDNRMRACGQEWRANKTALQAQGKTWLTFSTECRARLKAQGR